MSLRSRLMGLIRGAALPQPRPSSAWSQALMWLQGAPINAYPITTKQDKLSANIGWAYSAVTRIGMDVRAAPRKVWKKTGKERDDWEEIPEEDQAQIFSRPAANMMMDEFVQTTVMHLDLTGEAYWHLITGGEAGGKVLGVQLIYPHWVDEPVLDERGQLTHWRVTIPGRSYYSVPAEDMVFLKYPHPMDPLKGMSPVEAFAITHDMDIYTRAYASSLMKNRATPELVISLEGTVTPEQASVIRENWMDKYRDPANGPAVLGSGSKVQQLGLSIADLKFLELTQASRETILAVYGVPAAIIGLTTDFNRANSDTARSIYWQNCISPRLDMIEQAWNTAVMPRMNGRGRTISREVKDTLWWGFDCPPVEDRDFALRQADIMFKAGASTLNEYRERLGSDNIGKDGDVYYLPMGVNIISAISLATDEEPEPVPALAPPPDPNADPAQIEEKPPVPPKEPDAKEEEDDKTERFMGKLETFISNLPVVVRAPDNKPLKMRAAKAEFLERQGKLERSLKSEVRKLFSKEQAAIIARLKKEGTRSLPVSKPEQRLLWIEGHLTRDWTEDEIEEHSAEWEATLRDHILRGIREGWALAAMDLDKSIDWSLYNKRAEKYARELAGKKVTQISKTTLTGVRRVIGNGIESGASIDTIADDLRRLYDGFKGFRAETVARTETANAQNFGKAAQIDEAEERLGIKVMKTWVAVQDERTREDHVAADGQTVPNDEQFMVGSEQLDFPGDPNGSAETVINCRCTCTFSSAE